MDRHIRWAIVVAGASAALGCTRSAEHAAPVDEPEPMLGRAGAPSASRNQEPPEVYIGPTGTRFRFVGPAVVGIRKPGEPIEPPIESPEPESAEPPTLAELAEDLRPITLVAGKWEYVAEEPAYEVAEAILRGEVLGQPTEGREGRNIVGATCGAGGGPCDDRAEFGPNTSPIYEPTMMSQAGGSGTMIDRSTMITAAHIVFNTTSNFWIVVDGVSCTSSTESGTANTEDRRTAAPTTTNDCLPRWGAGVTTGSVPNGWLNCYNVTIPSAFRTSGSPSSARQNDFAIVDFNVSGCTSTTPGDNSGWRGTWIASEAQIESSETALFGYPWRAAPGQPDTSGGFASFFPVVWNPTSCSIGTPGKDGSAANSFTPCTSGQMLGMTVDSSYSVDPLNLGQTWKIGSTLMDTSNGQSGAGIWAPVIGGGSTTPPGDPRSFHLIGIHQASEAGPNGTVNIARRWDNSVHNFVVANSSFPTT